MRGVTMIEILLVVALLGILAALSASALGPLNMRFREQQAVELTVQTLTQAREAARARGRCHHVDVLAAGAVVAVGTAGDSLRIASRSNADCESGAPALLDSAVLPMPEGVTVSVDSGFAVPVFRPNGRTGDLTETWVTVQGRSSTRVHVVGNGPICVGTGSCP